MVNHPELLWAQRSSEYEPAKNIVFLTICLPELDPSYKLTIEGSRLTFNGHTKPPASADSTASKVEPKVYEFDLELFAEVEESKRALTGKSLSLVLKKLEAKAEYWPRLTKEKVKLNFVKTDFGKWKDEDEQEEEEAAPEEAPQGPPGMGGMGGGMGGMGGMGGAGGMDFSSMMAGMGGGAGGAGGMDFEAMMKQMQASGMGGMGGMGGAGLDGEDDAPVEEDDEDDGPPPLEEA